MNTYKFVESNCKMNYISHRILLCDYNNFSPGLELYLISNKVAIILLALIIPHKSDITGTLYTLLICEFLLK